MPHSSARDIPYMDFRVLCRLIQTLREPSCYPLDGIPIIRNCIRSSWWNSCGLWLNFVIKVKDSLADERGGACIPCNSGAESFKCQRWIYGHFAVISSLLSGGAILSCYWSVLHVD